jgi:hypothetical protein
MGIDAWLSASALAISVGGLVPIFIIKEDRRKELVIVIVVSLLIALTAVMAVRNHEHLSEVREIENEIVGTLPSNRWTSDQLYKQLNFPHRDVFFEALSVAIDQRRVRQAVVQVRIEDSPPVDVRIYWVEPARAQSGETGSPAPCGSLESKSAHIRESPRSAMKTAWERRVGLSYAPSALISAAPRLSRSDSAPKTESR